MSRIIWGITKFHIANMSFFGELTLKLFSFGTSFLEIFQFLISGTSWLPWLKCEPSTYWIFKNPLLNPNVKHSIRRISMVIPSRAIKCLFWKSQWDGDLFFVRNEYRTNKNHVARRILNTVFISYLKYSVQHYNNSRIVSVY